MTRSNPSGTAAYVTAGRANLSPSQDGRGEERARRNITDEIRELTD